MESSVYQHPKYYEVAYGFIDPKNQVDLFEDFINEYSNICVRRVLDICCGPALQLREFARRGYSAVGLDCSRPMLDYLTQTASAEQITVDTVEADMKDFNLKQQVDFAYVLLGSIHYVGDNSGLLAHLDSLARVLRTGGLYLIENMSIHWASSTFSKPMVWYMEQDGINVRATYQAELASGLEQTIHQTIDLQIDDNGNNLRLTDQNEVKLFFPQEFRTIVELHGQFDFLGFFERESTKPLKEASLDNIVLLRKR